jgi:hypothetical protein
MNKKVTLGLMAMAAYVFAASAFAGEPTRVPEPGTLGLLAAGIAGAVAVRLIKRK